MDVSDFDFDLPEQLIAQDPPEQRGGSRLLIMDRATGAIRHSTFAALADLLRSGDVLVVNDTRVFPARLLGRRIPSGGAVECLLVRQLATPDAGEHPTPNQAEEPTAKRASREVSGAGPAQPSEVVSSQDAGGGPTTPLGLGSSEEWEALVHPGQKLKPGAQVLFEGNGVAIHGEILERRFFGRRTIRLRAEGADLETAIGRIGHIPLPPYIRRGDRPSDHERYQTVYAKERGSIAAPTAGLHFTGPLLERLSAGGIEQVRVTLHVGYGTFKPVRTERVEEHTVDPERFSVTAAAADALTRAHRGGRRIIAVGTTTTRALESLDLTDDGRVLPRSGEATLFIHPGHRFRLVSGLITNFHLPKSSLLMLVAAFGGRDQVMNAYRAAVTAGYRFYSYGDAMIVM